MQKIWNFSPLDIIIVIERFTKKMCRVCKLATVLCGFGAVEGATKFITKDLTSKILFWDQYFHPKFS